MRKHDYYHCLFLLYGFRCFSIFGAIVTTVMALDVVSDAYHGTGRNPPFVMALVFLGYFVVVVTWLISWRFTPLLKKHKPTSVKPPKRGGDQKN